MKLSLLTREYPPSIYGGAGVHVAQLVPQLRKFIEVDVHCMGEPRGGAGAPRGGGHRGTPRTPEGVGCAGGGV